MSAGGNPLRAAAVLMLLMAILSVLLLSACAPTPFLVGREVSTPAGCVDAKERGHEC